MRWPTLLVMLVGCGSGRSPTSESSVPVRTPVAHIAPSTSPAAPRQGAIAGTVRDRYGQRLEGAVMIAYSASHAQVAVVTDENGTYLIEDLPPGEYTVTLYHLETAVEYHVTVGKDVVELNAIAVPSPTGTAPVSFPICGGDDVDNTDGIDATGLTVD